jgi:SPP1 gp7 family putative phage head morphogenesis protein
MINLSALQKVRYAKATVRFLDNLERGLRIRLEQEFKRTASEVAKSYPDYKLALANHEKRLEKLLTTFAGSTVGATISRLRSFGLLSRPTSKADDQTLETKAKKKVSKRLLTEEQLMDKLVATAVKRAAERLAPDIASRTAEVINKLVVDGTEEMLHPRQIASLIAKELPDIGRSRALTIARTESHTIAMETELESWKDDEDVLYKEWVSTSDDRTRPDHDHANGQKVKMDEPFKVGDSFLDHPGDPNGPPEQVINCRCVMVYSVK